MAAMAAIVDQHSATSPALVVWSSEFGMKWSAHHIPCHVPSSTHLANEEVSLQSRCGDGHTENRNMLTRQGYRGRSLAS
jgi:hypothetical protein